MNASNWSGKEVIRWPRYWRLSVQWGPMRGLDSTPQCSRAVRVSAGGRQLGPSCREALVSRTAVRLVAVAFPAWLQYMQINARDLCLTP